MPKRYYTVEQAKALLPKVRLMLGELITARGRIAEAEPELWSVLEKAVRNGGSKKAGIFLSDFEIIRRHLYALDALGIEVKDLNTGLIDFWSKRDGRDVYLCWRYGEDDLEYWHEIDAGFTGRQPL